MGEIIKGEETDISEVKKNLDVLQATENMLMDARADIENKEFISMPIAELSTLGAGVSSLIPALNTVTQSTVINMQGLYRVANAVPGDVLKMAKNQNYWGALKTADGASKMAQFTQAGALNATTTTVTALNPATMMMAVALFSIEKKLGNIEEMQKQIIQNMQFEKESKIEGDVEQLLSIIKKYKYNWDSERFIATNHKMVNDIQRTARANMISYQKEVNSILKTKKFVVVQNMIKTTQNELLKKMKYYRLSLYTFSMASLLEIMLGGNFKEEYICGIKKEIEKLSIEYRDIFERSSFYMEKMSAGSVESNVLKGVGNISKFTGKVIGSIPVVEKGPVDEFLQESGTKIKKSAKNIDMAAVKSLAKISNPGTSVFVDKMQDIMQIYNHTSEICVDNQYIYLLQEA